MQALLGVQFLLVIRGCKNLAQTLTWEWALPIHVAKPSTWALSWEVG